MCSRNSPPSASCTTSGSTVRKTCSRPLVDAEAPPYKQQHVQAQVDDVILKIPRQSSLRHVTKYCLHIGTECLRLLFLCADPEHTLISMMASTVLPSPDLNHAHLAHSLLLFLHHFFRKLLLLQPTSPLFTTTRSCILNEHQQQACTVPRQLAYAALPPYLLLLDSSHQPILISPKAAKIFYTS